MRQLVVARLSKRDASRRRDQTVGISVLFTHVTNVHQSKKTSLDHFSTQSRLRRTNATKRYYRVKVRDHPRDGWQARGRDPPIRSVRSEPKIYRSRVSQHSRSSRDLIAPPYTTRHERALAHFLDDDMVFTRVVPRLLGRRDVSCTLRRIRGFRTSWTKKVREEEDDDQGVEEERKAHTRAWFQ